jgi:hypothetical protein
MTVFVLDRPVAPKFRSMGGPHRVEGPLCFPLQGGPYSFGSLARGMVSRTCGRGRPLNAPAAFILHVSQSSPSSPRMAALVRLTLSSRP